MEDDTFYIVQSRPITTLFPIPEANDDANRAYLSVGHQQMMTDPIKPLGLSFYLLTTPAPMRKAGGRLFVDITNHLTSTVGRENLLNMAGKSDPLINDALLTLINRRDFIKLSPDDEKKQSANNSNKVIPSSPQIESDPSIVSDLIKKSQTSIEVLKQSIQSKSGVELLDFILEDFQELKRILFDPQSSPVLWLL